MSAYPIDRRPVDEPPTLAEEQVQIGKKRVERPVRVRVSSSNVRSSSRSVCVMK